MILNLARLFSYTRQVEKDRDEKALRVRELEAKVEELLSYVLVTHQQPPLSIVKPRETEPGATVKTGFRPLRAVRREFRQDMIRRAQEATRNGTQD